jgi:hypothetical protein
MTTKDEPNPRLTAAVDSLRKGTHFLAEKGPTKGRLLDPIDADHPAARPKRRSSYAKSLVNATMPLRRRGSVVQ